MQRSSRFSRKVQETNVQESSAGVDVDYDDMTFSDFDHVVIPKKISIETSSSSKITKKKEIQKLMDDNRESAQAVAISEDNRGFKLLQKFGYNASQGGLGKLNTGLVVPITVTKRAAEDRAGLGVFEQKKKKVEEKVLKESIKAKLAENIMKNFKSEMISKQQVLLLTRDLNKASRIIHELDFRSGITENHLWPPDTLLVESEEHSVARIEDIDVLTKLEESVEYLKYRYSYCIHCGFQYENLEEFERDCPGPTEDDH